jgi:hypothetical protein
MDAELVVQDNISSNRNASSASRPALYISIILGVALAACAYKLRTDGIFACQAGGYTSDRYLSYCHNSGYGDYEHGAFWFGLEPSIRNFAANAEVLFLGSSRMQLALSTRATADWFSSTSARYYLMGFGYNENAVFAHELLLKFKPRAKVYVVNIERFFDRTETVPAAAVMRDPGAKGRYEVKRLWQLVHRPICQSLPMICGDQYVIFRSRETGAFSVSGLSQFKGAVVSYDQSVDQTAVQNEAAIGREFLSELPVRRECIILTMVPYARTKVTAVNALANALGMNLVWPDVDELQTFDGSHLDRPSAERWSKAFLQVAAPQIRKCLADSRESRP